MNCDKLTAQERRYIDEIEDMATSANAAVADYKCSRQDDGITQSGVDDMVDQRLALRHTPPELFECLSNRIVKRLDGAEGGIGSPSHWGEALS